MAVFRTSRAIAGIVNVLTNVWFLSVESVRNRAPLKRDIIVATEVGSECRFLAGFDYQRHRQESNPTESRTSKLLQEHGTLIILKIR